jgi:hypothetical protein
LDEGEDGSRLGGDGTDSAPDDGSDGLDCSSGPRSYESEEFDEVTEEHLDVAEAELDRLRAKGAA